MSASRIISPELFQACATIFGPEIKVSSAFLEYLQPINLKTAYRKRALETHPDRTEVLEAFARDLNAEFINVRQAYERLISFIETKDDLNVSPPYFEGFRKQQQSSYQNFRQHHDDQSKKYHHQRHYYKRQKNHPDHFFNGSLPKGNLMMGQFLYYSGLISWQTLIEAICWQRRQRPLIGQIATDWGLITYHDVLQILNVRNFDEKFGECALRVGYISCFELFALVGKQKKIQRPFGEYFIERGLLSSDEIINIARKQQSHNMTSFK